MPEGIYVMKQGECAMNSRGKLHVCGHFGDGEVEKIMKGVGFIFEKGSVWKVQRK